MEVTENDGSMSTTHSIFEMDPSVVAARSARFNQFLIEISKLGEGAYLSPQYFAMLKTKDSTCSAHLTNNVV